MACALTPLHGEGCSLSALRSRSSTTLYREESRHNARLAGPHSGQPARAAIVEEQGKLAARRTKDRVFDCMLQTCQTTATTIDGALGRKGRDGWKASTATDGVGRRMLSRASMPKSASLIWINAQSSTFARRHYIRERHVKNSDMIAETEVLLEALMKGPLCDDGWWIGALDAASRDGAGSGNENASTIPASAVQASVLVDPGRPVSYVIFPSWFASHGAGADLVHPSNSD